MGQLQLEIGETATIKKEYKVRVPPYSCVCNNSNYKGIKGMNPIPLFITMNGATASFFWTLYNDRDTSTNISIYIPKSKSEQVSISKWFNELKKLELLKRVKPRTYIINPRAFYPKLNQFEEVCKHWDSL